MPIIQPVGTFEPVKGQLVYFGRRHGEQTLGKVEKVNRATVKVKQLESRGAFKDHKIGTLWNVARALVTPAPADAVEPAPATGGESMEEEIARLRRENAALKGESPKPAPYGASPKDPLAARFAKTPAKREEKAILDEIRGVYSALSPENLWMDGEATRAQARSRAASLNRQLKALFEELGRPVSEDQAFA